MPSKLLSSRSSKPRKPRLRRTQAETSPENAQHSTGPTTAAGKAVCALNAVDHGLCSSLVLLPGEDPTAFNAHRAALFDDLDPVGHQEIELTERLAGQQWRRQRAERVEAETLAAAFAPAANGDPDAPPPATNLGEAFQACDQAMMKILRYTTQIVRELNLIAKELAMHMNARRIRETQNRKQAAEDAVILERARVAAESALAFVANQTAQAATVAAAAAAAAAAPAAAKLPATPSAAAPVVTPAASPFFADYTPVATGDALDAVHWPDVVQELYWAASAGSQGPHPLPETYYGAYVVWLKQVLMVDLEITDDEAGSQLAALQVAFEMRVAGVGPRPGCVWGAPPKLALWRQAAVQHGAELKIRWDNAIRTGFANEEGTVRAAAEAFSKLPPEGDLDAVPGPWQITGDQAQKDRAQLQAEQMKESS